MEFGPHYGWFVDIPLSGTTAHRLPTGSDLVAQAPHSIPAVCGERRQRWQAVDDFEHPEVFTRCPNCPPNR